MDDIPTIDEIIKDDEMLIKIGFVSKLMLYRLTTQQMCERYAKEYGENISQYKMTKLRHAARMVYLTQISKERDEQVAEELMQAEWETRELIGAWEKSKQTANKKTVKHNASQVSDAPELSYSLDETTESIEETPGDIRYMEQIGKVRQRVVNILGLEAPKQQAQQSNNGNLPTVTINVVGGRRNIQVEDVEVINNNESTAKQ